MEPVSDQSDTWHMDSEPVRSDDHIVHGPKWRRALEEIRDADPIDLALDPTWSQRIARAALDENQSRTED